MPLTTPPVAVESSEAVWEVSISRPAPADLPPRAKLLDALRPQLVRRLQADPSTQAMSLPTPLGTINLRRRSGTGRSPVRLIYAADTSADPARPTLPKGDAAVTLLPLPNDEIAEEGRNLIPFGGLRAQLAALLTAAGSEQAAQWSQRTGTPLPSAFRAHQRRSSALVVLTGDPGTGKSLHARVSADDLCRATGIAGTLVIMAAERGNGLVGNLAGRIHAVFDRLESLPADVYRFLLLDEAEALVPARAGGHAMHHEDLAGVDVFLQRVDRLAGQPRTAVLLTSNLKRALDPAVLRRAQVLQVHRPDTASLAALLKTWLPHLPPRDIAKAARFTRHLTFADLDRALFALYATAIQNGTAVTQREVVLALRRAERSRSLE